MDECKPLVAGSTTLAAALELSAATAALAHTGATGLAITSASGYVDVEDVRFNGAVIGIGATTVLTLAAGGATVAGTLTAGGATTLSSTLAVTSLATLSAGRPRQNMLFLQPKSPISAYFARIMPNYTRFSLLC